MIREVFLYKLFEGNLEVDDQTTILRYPPFPVWIHSSALTSKGSLVFINYQIPKFLLTLQWTCSFLKSKMVSSSKPFGIQVEQTHGFFEYYLLCQTFQSRSSIKK